MIFQQLGDNDKDKDDKNGDGKKRGSGRFE